MRLPSKIKVFLSHQTLRLMAMLQRSMRLWWLMYLQVPRLPLTVRLALSRHRLLLIRIAT
nr:MAG TPA: hypothetical protein [Caudoviricetes sp.]